MEREVLDQLVPSGTYDRIAPVLRDRYGDLVSGLTLRLPDDERDDEWLADLIAALQRS